MFSSCAAPGLLVGAGVRVKYVVHPGARDAPEAPCAQPTTTSFSLLLASSLARQAVNQLTSGQNWVPKRASAVPISILQLQSVDEKSKSAVTKLGLLPSTVLTVQSREERGGGGGLPGCKHWDCWLFEVVEDEDYIIEITITSPT